MTATLRILCLGCLSMVLTVQARAQVQQASYTQPHYSAGRVDRMTPAMRYFGRGRQVPQAQRTSRRPAAAAQQVRPAAGKPFEHVDRGPTVSPYLSLDMVQTNEGIPNYYSRVLPQIEQQEANAKQAAELRRLQQQLRLANAPGLNLKNRAAGVPTTGSSKQFMNRGSYFPTIQR